ncbi:MAG: AAA family ATPase [Proteobacteria bacterium]|nr:AAA family ATPase [Pseudomonadota bacterium]
MTLAGFHLGSPIYESNQSLIFRGWRAKDELPVILKLLKDPYPAPEKIAEFKQEYERTRSLNSGTGAGSDIVGVVVCHGLEVTQHRWVMVLEDFGGSSLAFRLKSRGPFAVGDFLPLAIEIADTLGKIHQRHIIHKDINPSNIVLNEETGQLKIIDFGISTALSRESTPYQNVTALQGTPAYMSPEQTGRMNRTLDYRTDFYSLGVTFYELLAGQRPFPTGSLMTMIHAHIASSPPPLHGGSIDIPRQLSAIIDRLMAKNAENRYQSSYGLKADLEQCHLQWQKKKSIDRFAIGTHDLIDRFRIPQTLYGRAREVDTLMAAFGRVARGGKELMLVAGYSGIGKSTLVREVYKPITEQSGYFLAGKFDQLRRDKPYEAVIESLRSLTRQLLTESEQQIASWSKTLRAALDPNAWVLTEIIPELELIVGRQEKTESKTLSHLETQTRLHLTFQKLIGALTGSEHPLVMFLDDLQWADPASLTLVYHLMTGPESKYFFVIGAYRDNEVGDAHPLLLTLKQLKRSGVSIHQIELGPLNHEHTRQFVAATLHSSREKIRSLAQLVFSKTKGNPFFMVEFLESLHREKLIEFVSRESGSAADWQWDVREIEAKNLTDNVIELLTNTVKQLGSEAQDILQVGACIGYEFDLRTLALVCEKPDYETARALWRPLQEGLIVPQDNAYKLMGFDVDGLSEAISATYRFAHDRVQQATYSLIPRGSRAGVHKRVGELLLENTPPEEREQRIFDIVKHLNPARELIASDSERDELIELNRLAARKAKSSAAYKAALDYLLIALELQGSSPFPRPAESDPDNTWFSDYELSMALHLEAAEAAFSSGDYERMELMTDIIHHRARSSLDRVPAYVLQLGHHMSVQNPVAVAETLTRGLAEFSVQLSTGSDEEALENAKLRAKALWQGKEIASLIDLPSSNDPENVAIMNMLNSTLNAPHRYFVLAILEMVNRSLAYGNTRYSPYAYVMYGSLLCCDELLDEGYQFGRLGLRLLEKCRNKIGELQCHYMFEALIRIWKEHGRETIQPLLEVYKSGLENGSLLHVGMGLDLSRVFAYWTGEDLRELEDSWTKYLGIIEEQRQTLVSWWTRPGLQAVHNLRGHGDEPWRLSGKIFDESSESQYFFDVNDNPGIYFFSIHKMIMCFLFDKYDDAFTVIPFLERSIPSMVSCFSIVPFYFYDSLLRLAVFDSSDDPEKALIIDRIESNRARMELWAQHAPMNFLHKLHLIDAERARALGRDERARECYDKAIDLAHEHGYLNEEALAYELAGRFYRQRGKARLARYYFQDAYYAYSRWGAIAKAEQLNEQYPDYLLKRRSEAESMSSHGMLATTTATTSGRSHDLDRRSVFEASLAISSEIALDKLLSTLMRVVIENAGARAGYLLLEDRGNWTIAVEGSIADGDEQSVRVSHVQSMPVGEARSMSEGIVNYVRRTRESVVLSDAAHEGLFMQDEYVQRAQPKSILCAPLIKQGKLIGILYLENNMSIGAFTPGRLETLSILSAQAAIAIENANLYTHQVDLRNAYSRFVPPEYLGFLDKETIIDVHLGDHVSKEMAVMFSDIRAFSALSETMSPQENFDFVNAYLQRVSPVVREHEGIIVKYLGDGVMAVFPNGTDSALAASIGKLDTVARYNEQRQRKGYQRIQIGIGIHTGHMMVGIVGEAARMQGDAFSDNVNLAARLEGLTKHYGVSLLMSEDAYRSLRYEHGYSIRWLGKVQVSGRQEAISIYEVFDPDPDELRVAKRDTKAEFERGLAEYYNRNFAATITCMTRVLGHLADDFVAQLYRDRAAMYVEQGVAEDWDGVISMTEK